MRFTVDRDALAEAVGWVARALPSKPVLPVLSGMLLHAGPQQLTLSCFDYDVSAIVTIEAEVAEPGAALVPGKLLAEITRSLPSHPALFADDPDGIAITCGSAAFNLVSLPPDEYPALPELPVLAGTVDGGEFAVAIGQIAPAASRDDTLPILTGVNLEISGAAITLVATDRYRLAMRELGWEPVSSDPLSLLVPARSMTDAARMMSAGTPVRIMLGADAGTDAMVGFDAGERRLTTRLIAGEFIKYRSRFPAEFGCHAELPAAGLAEALRRVSLVAEPGSPVRLSFGSGQVTIEAGSKGHARATETVPAEFTGDEPDIAFSPHYLLDGVLAANVAAVKATEKGEGEAGGGPAQIELDFTSSTKPAVITGGEDFKYLVVPQRIYA
jgi:DNA polymerase-3 subunit beta